MKQEFLSLDYAADSDSFTQSNEEVMSIHENNIRGVKSFMTFLFYILLHFTINIDANISVDICCTLASWSNFLRQFVGLRSPSSTSLFILQSSSVRYDPSRLSPFHPFSVMLEAR